MNEDYCSYELAKKLKACGFDEPCDHYYTPNKVMRIAKDNALAPEITNNRFLDEIDDGCCTAVPLWHAQKWLREKHKWHIVIEPRIWEQQVYDYKLWSFMRGYENANRGLDYLSYEQALSAGIYAALELIKEGE